MPWVEDGNSNFTIQIETVALPKAALSELRFEDAAGNVITKAKAGDTVRVKLVLINSGGTGSLAGTVDRLDTGARIIDQQQSVASGSTVTWSTTFTMPIAAVTVTARWWHWE